MQNFGWCGRVFAYAPLIIWIVVILGLGSGLGAANETSRIIRPLLEYFFPTTSPDTLSLYHFYLRKFAHFAEYAILALLACRAFYSSRTRPGKFPLVLAALLVLLVALFDEINQSFDATRTGSPWDVLVDLSGGLFAILIWHLISRRHGLAGTYENRGDDRRA